MRGKTIIFILASILTSVSITATAQKTKEYVEASPLFEHAKMLYIKGLYVPAIEEFNRFLATNPGPNFDYEARAYIALSRLKLDKSSASQDLSRLVRSEPEHKLNEEIGYELGLYYFKKRKYARALKYLEDINEKTLPTDRREELIFKKGYSYFKNKEYTSAKKEFAKILNTDGRYSVEANYYYGYQCYILKDYDCALSTFEKIGDKGPKTMQLYIAQIYYEQEKYEEAFEIIKSLKIEKQADQIELLTGKIQYQLGNRSIALTHFNKYKGDVETLSDDEIYQFANANFEAGNYKISTKYFLLISNKENAIGQAANYHLGVSDVNQEKKSRAMNAFAEAKRKDFNKEITEESAFNYAKLAAELQQNSIAISAIKEFIDTYPASTHQDEAKKMMVDIFLTTKNYKAAIEVLEGMSQMTTDTKKAYQELTFHRAEELYLNKQYQDANVFFKKSLKYPKDAELEALAYFWLGEIAYKVDDYDESINNMNRFVSGTSSQSKNKTYAYYSLGYNYFKKKDYTKAQNYFAQFNKYETYNNANKKIYLNNTQRLADCYFLNRQYDLAIKEYQFIIDKDYKNADYAIFQQGMLYGLQNRTSEKITVLKNIQKDFPKSMYVDDALYQIGRGYLDLENYTMAEKFFNQVISQHDYSAFLPDSYLKMGLIYYTKKDNRKALSYYKTVVERFPKTAASKEALSFIEVIYTNDGDVAGYFKYLKSINQDAEISYQDSSIYRSALARYQQEDCVGATKIFNNYISQFGDNGYFIIPANYYKAECDYFNDRKAQAMRHYEYVVSQGKNDYSEKSLIKLCREFFRNKDYEKALKYYKMLEIQASNKGNFVSSIVGQMRCNEKLGNESDTKEKAIELLTLEDVPTDEIVEANLILGRIQFASNNYLTAKSHFDYVIANSRNAQTAEAYYNRAFIYYNQDELEKAREDVYKLNEDYSAYEFWVVKGFIILADIYVKEKDYFQAKATLQSIIDNYSNESDGLLDICRQKLKEVEELENPAEIIELEEE